MTHSLEVKWEGWSLGSFRLELVKSQSGKVIVIQIILHSNKTEIVFSLGFDYNLNLPAFAVDMSNL